MREKFGERRKRISVPRFYPKPIRRVKSDRLLGDATLPSQSARWGRLSCAAAAKDGPILVARTAFVAAYRGTILGDRLRRGLARLLADDPEALAFFDDLISSVTKNRMTKGPIAMVAAMGFTFTVKANPETKTLGRQDDARPSPGSPRCP
jgi:hypothetical protein